MKENEDEVLMQQYAKGEVKAFTELYLRHKNSLYRYFMRQLSSKELAEELYQEVWNKLIKARSTYQVSSKFTTWLYRIAHNELIDYYRRNTIEKKIIVTSAEEIVENVDVSNNETKLADNEQISAYDILHSEQQKKQLKCCLKQLPRQQKEAFLLKHESGFTLNEIAQLIGESSESVKSRIRYGLSKLKHCVMNKMRSSL